MNNKEKLLSLIDTNHGALSKYDKIDSKTLLEYFRTRENPRYLFSIDDVARNKDEESIRDAEKVLNHDIFGWCFNGEIDYLFNPTEETSRDNEWSWSLFRTIYWQPLARAYASTGDRKYFDEFIHEMKQFISTWPAEKYILDHTFEVKTPFPGHAWRTIEAGIRIYTTWLPCFEIFRHSELWNEEDFSEFLLAIRDHARFLLGHYSNHERSSNWLSMEATALYQIGVMFPEFKEAKEWKNVGYQRVMHEIMYCFSNSGIHMERTPIYHLVATIAFMQAVELSKLNNIPVAPYAYTLLVRAAEYVMSLIKPDLSTPMIGDADRDDLTTRRADISIYEGMNLSFFPDDLNELRAFFKWMYRISGKAEFLYFSSLRKEGKAPETLDFCYSSEGLYICRSSWESDGDYVLLHSVSLERGEKSTHSHNDTAHVDVSLYGEDILVDSGRYIYRSSIWRDWREYFCSPLAHNTLYVDGHEMGAVPNVTRVRGVRAICNEFSNINGVKIIDISHNGYAFMPDSIFHRRKVLLLPNHVAIIIDYVTGLGNDVHDFILSFNFNKGNVFLKKDDVAFITEKGTEFHLSFNSTADFTSEYLYGSEQPKGGWISYGYPIREPNGQVLYKYNGKAPFTAVTSISDKNTDVMTMIGKNAVSSKTAGITYIIKENSLEVL